MLDKYRILDVLKLLSALESWSFATGKTMPDYLHESLADAIEYLTKELLEEK